MKSLEQDSRSVDFDLAPMVNWAIITLLVGGVIHAIVAILLDWGLALQISASSIVCNLVALAIAKLGKPRAALLTAVLCANTACLYSAYAQEGIDNIAVSILPVIVMFASLLLDRSLPLYFAGLTAVGTAGMVCLRWAQGLEQFHRNELGELVIVISTIGLAAAVGQVLAGKVRKTLVGLRRSEVQALETAERLRASELRWHLSLRGSNDGVWDWNPVTNELYVSDRWKTMLGYTPDQIAGTVSNWRHLVHPDDLDRVEGDVFAHIEGKTEFFISEYRMKASDGSYRWILARGKALRDATGRAIRMAGSHSDITERKAAVSNAEAASRAKSEFLANLSHEVRTPMNAILGMAELIRRADTEEERQRYTDEMIACARALVELLSHLLDLSRIESGKLVLAQKPFSVRFAVNATLPMFTALAQQNCVDVSVSIDGAIPTQVVGDVARLRQILMNLVGNAIKFTRRGRVGIHIGMDDRVQEVGMVRLKGMIWDEGEGIKPEVLPRIFEPFFQGDTSETREHDGIGLGLAICKRLIEQMGGQLWAESEHGKGATFHFTATFGKCEFPTEDQPIETPQRSEILAKNSGNHNRAKVLLVEDNLVNQRIAQRLLEKHAHEVRVAGNGLEAVRLATEDRFDLILMDLHMPQMNGTDAAAEIRRREAATSCRTPIWALTAAIADADIERCLAVGMDGVLEKPFDLRQLLEVVERAAGNSPRHDVRGLG